MVLIEWIHIFPRYCALSSWLFWEGGCINKWFKMTLWLRGGERVVSWRVRGCVFLRNFPHSTGCRFIGAVLLLKEAEPDSAALKPQALYKWRIEARPSCSSVKGVCGRSDFTDRQELQRQRTTQVTSSTWKSPEYVLQVVFWMPVQLFINGHVLHMVEPALELFQSTWHI